MSLNLHVYLLELKGSFIVLAHIDITPGCRIVVLLCLLTRKIEECIENVEAVCVSTLNELVGVHLSDIGSAQSECRYTHKHSNRE